MNHHHHHHHQQQGSSSINIKSFYQHHSSNEGPCPTLTNTAAASLGYGREEAERRGPGQGLRVVRGAEGCVLCGQPGQVAQLVEQEFQVQELCCLENGSCGKPWPLENTTSNSLRIKFLLLVRLVGCLFCSIFPLILRFGWWSQRKFQSCQVWGTMMQWRTSGLWGEGFFFLHNQGILMSLPQRQVGG